MPLIEEYIISMAAMSILAWSCLVSLGKIRDFLTLEKQGPFWRMVKKLTEYVVQSKNFRVLDRP